MACIISSFEYPKNVRFKCVKCAICCGDTEERVRNILLMKVEAHRISQDILRDIDEFAEKTEGFEPYIYRMKKTQEGKCKFLKNNLCTIYRTRPLTCIFYPFELKKIGSKRYAFAYTNECPAIGKGPQLKRKRFKTLFERAMNTLEC